MRILISVLVALALIFGGTVGSVAYIDKQVSTPLDIPSTQLFTVPQGSSAYKVAYSLREASVSTIPPMVSKLWLKFFASNSNIKSGTYQLMPGQSFKDIVGMLSRGDEHYFAVSLVEGLTLREWLSTLKSQPHLHDDLSDETIQDIIKRVPWPNLPSHGEGLMLADTYYFTANTAASAILARAQNAMLQYIEEQWQQRALDLPLRTPYEALILASIIEKETAVSSERAKIAGVFINRLRKKMRLQTDPTVIYGIGEVFDGNITRQHLRTPTPYNTYTIKGLPPTPIAMAGKAAIHAALNPMETDALYFVARGDGSHQFSSSLEAHNAAVREYQLNKK